MTGTAASCTTVSKFLAAKNCNSVNDFLLAGRFGFILLFLDPHSLFCLPTGHSEGDDCSLYHWLQMPIESALTKIRLLGRLLKLKNRILLEQSLKQTLHNSLNLLSIKFSHFCLELFDFPVGLYVGTPFIYSNIYLCDIKEGQPSLSASGRSTDSCRLSVVSSHPSSQSKFLVMKTM